MKLIAIGEIEHTDLETKKLKVAKPGEPFNVDADTGDSLLAMVPPVVRKATKADAKVAAAADDGDGEEDEPDEIDDAEYERLLARAAELKLTGNFKSWKRPTLAKKVAEAEKKEDIV